MDTLFIIYSALIGLIVGSFLNCLIWRLYKEESIIGRSYCPRCRKQIAWHDNIPVLSFILLGGRCRHCKKRISWQYPLVELVTGVLFVLVFLINNNLENFTLLLARDWLLISGLIVIFIYDLRWQLVPMLIVWPLTFIIIILNLLIGIPWQDIALYGFFGSLFFLVQYILTRGKGLGEGDIWLGLLIGASFASWQLLSLSLFLAYMVGALVGMFLLIGKKKELKSRIALGPFLVFGAIITLIYGSKIIEWYFGLV